MQDLVRVCNNYDVGIFFQEPLNFNLESFLFPINSLSSCRLG